MTLDVLAQRLTAVAEDARAEAEMLIAHVLNTSRARVMAGLAQPDAAQSEQIAALAERRAAGVPMAYLTGQCGFWTLDLQVTPDVLIPRADTETLLQWALEVMPQDARIADLGTGSGCIALVLAQERPKAEVWATDASVAALKVARSNAERLRLTQLHFAQGHWLQPLGGRFQLIVSNPPYIAEGDPHLPALAHEPRSALTAGVDGLDALREIIRTAPSHLQPGGWLLLEHGYDQAAAVRDLLVAAGFQSVESRRDLGGNERASGGHWHE